MINYENQIQATLKSTYEDGVKQGRALGMSALHIKILEAVNSISGFDVDFDLSRMIDELKGVSDDPMTSRQYEADAKADHRTDI